MSKEEVLHAIKLLSALESWVLGSTKERLPGYLSDNLLDVMEVLERIVLEGST